MYGRETEDFWLVNPITRHEFHFPHAPFYFYSVELGFCGILVFSSSISRWVFVISRRCTCRIWFPIAGEGAWNHVSSTSDILDIHALKGKIYTLHTVDHYSWKENLYVMMETYSKHSSYKVHELDFGEMKWVPFEETSDEYDFFYNHSEPSAAVKQESWVDPPSPNMKYYVTNKSEKGKFFYANMWYFPHECMNVDLLHE
ncbi:unnamed protein product [Lactuca virosa]|uniref:F-box associated domain-containing protein n=1 Tax=Lactuca virosa TaxID=75947 RepID=A0AAU9ML33_9ASTR|nr:unnamed protein product [Lactuca virosa]